MGILLLAKKKGFLEKVAPIMNEIEEKAGFYLGRSLKRQILQDAGEGGEIV
jgi:predicted nucleic acid-binding protein